MGLGPVDPDPGVVDAAVVCKAVVATGVVDCATPQSGSGHAVSAALVLGGQDILVRLASSNVSYDPGTEQFTFDVTIQNLIGQALGSRDGSTVDGVQVFFHHLPTATSGTGAITVEGGARDDGTFTKAGDGASDPTNPTRGRTTAKQGGGTVDPQSGGAITGMGTAGISLKNTGDVTLRNMVIRQNQGDGINATNVGKLTLDNMAVKEHDDYRGVYVNGAQGLTILHSEIGDNSTSFTTIANDLWNLDLVNVTGTASITYSRIHDSAENVLHLVNTQGMLDLVVHNTTIQDITNGNGALVDAQGCSFIKASFRGDSVINVSSTGLWTGTAVGSTGRMELTIDGNTFIDVVNAILTTHGSQSSLDFDIINNTTRTVLPNSTVQINVNRAGSVAFGAPGSFTGTVANNVVGVEGVPNSGSVSGDGISVQSNGSGGTTRVTVRNNTVRVFDSRGIYLRAADTKLGGYGTPRFEVRVQDNDIGGFGDWATDGIHIQMGALGTDDTFICLDISGNSIAGAKANGIRFRTGGTPRLLPWSPSRSGTA